MELLHNHSVLDEIEYDFIHNALSIPVGRCLSYKF